MSKITEYTSASTFDTNDVLLKDGENGTMIISVEDAASEFRRLSGVDDDISGNTQAITQAMDTIDRSIAGVETDYIASKDYAIGDLFIVNNVLYKATAAIAEEDIIDTETNCAVVNLGDEIGDIRSELSNKANVDGSYDEFTAGSSKQLLGTVFIEDDEPYLFRTSGGSIDIGDREYDEIVGGSIVWNQLIQNGNFADENYWKVNLTGFGTFVVADNIATLTVGSSAVGNVSAYFSNILASAYSANHVFLASTTVKPSRETSVRYAWPVIFYGTASTICSEGVWTNVSNIVKAKDSANDTTTSAFYYNVDNNVVENDTIQFKNANLFDLTQMFGSEIADYVYNLEQTTPGAGVAWFRKYFPKDYYEYNAGELMHVSDLQSHDMVGFNLFDKSIAVPDEHFIEAGTSSIANGTSRSDYIPVLPNTTYNFVNIHGHSIMSGVFWFDSNKNFISLNYLTGASPKSGKFTSPSNAAYVGINFRTIDINSVCINLSWDGERDGEYEPYVKHSYPLDSSLTLRGIPKLSTDGKLYFDGDRYASDGTVTRKYGIVDLGTLEWSYIGTYEMFIAGLGNKKAATPNLLVSSSIYTISSLWFNTSGWANADKIILYTGQDASVRFKDSSYTDAAAFKAAMSGVYLVYELAEPTTEEAQPFQSPQIVDDFGTEEYVTTSLVPVGHITQYDSNLRAKLEMAPNSPDGDGDYLVRQTGGQNEYVPYTDGGRITALEGKIPAAPSTDGSYILKCTVTDGTATYAWVAE